MFFEPLCKSSRGFTNVFLITVNPATLKSIDDPTLFEDWIFILGGHQEAFDGFTSFKIHLYTMFVTGLFEPLSIILWVKTFSHIPYGVSKIAGKTFSSDLRKLTAVSKSLSLSKN